MAEDVDKDRRETNRRPPYFIVAEDDSHRNRALLDMAADVLG